MPGQVFPPESFGASALVGGLETATSASIAAVSNKVFIWDLARADAVVAPVGRLRAALIAVRVGRPAGRPPRPSRPRPLPVYSGTIPLPKHRSADKFRPSDRTLKSPP